MSKALDLLQNSKSVKERAAKYVERIQRTIQTEIIDSLTEEVEKMEDEIFELENFNLDTNLNRGLKEMTKETCEARFKSIIEMNYKIDLKKAELESKTKSFNALFGESKKK